MLGRALDMTFQNFSTLFLLAAIFFVPLHLAHAYVFRDELAVQELRPEIEEFPDAKKVRNVGPAELARERATLWALAALDLLIAAALFGVARRVHEVYDAGDVPTVSDALRAGRGRLRSRPAPAAAIGGVVVGTAVAWLVYRIGTIAAEALGASAMFVGIGLARGLTAAAFVAVALGCAAASARSSRPPAAQLDLY